MARHRWDDPGPEDRFMASGAGSREVNAVGRGSGASSSDRSSSDPVTSGASADPVPADGEGTDPAPWDVAAWERAADGAGTGPGALGAPRGARRSRTWGVRALLVLLILAAGLVSWRIADARLGGSEVVAARAPAAATAPGSASAGSSGASASGVDGASGADGPSGAGAATGSVSGTEGTAATASPAAGAAGGTSAPTQSVHVHVAGAVKHPGLYVLATGARAQDAVKAAGGAARGADLDAVNLAAVVQDGVQLRIPLRGEAAAPADGGAGAATAAVPGEEEGAAGQGAAGGGQGTVRINSADSTQLQTLPGIGPAMAERLLQWRAQHGRFGSATDLDAVPGIGPAMLTKLEPLVSYD